MPQKHLGLNFPVRQFPCQVPAWLVQQTLFCRINEFSGLFEIGQRLAPSATVSKQNTDIHIGDGMPGIKLDGPGEVA
jgi:hypothetical protein